MSSIWNNRISVSIFGESQDPTAGITISGLPAGEFIDAEEVSSFMARRYPSALRNSSQPCIQASPRIISGVLNERTTGAPLCALIQNAEIRHIEYPVEVPTDRVGTSDYTGTVRYRGYTDVMYLDKFTDRLTAPLCFAGAVCGQILERRGIYTGAHILQLHNIKDNPFDPVNISRDGVISVRSKDFPVIHDKKGWDMLADVEKARETGESLGGIVECAAINVPAGVGSPLFDGLGNTIAQLIFGIPGVKGLEFGTGFGSAEMLGSQNDDEFCTDKFGRSFTKTNNHGGIIGGISSGMPITLKVGFVPALPVSAADSSSDHEACFVPKAVPCVEAAVNIALLSHMLDYPNFC
ncbi:chorismate synthase [Ruminococcus sp. XPD3002]|uniref:chorismate synthase n=1 Tax=Ruminococcus sp. XPD3002 TaxID=1452269 RepID=UPI00091C630B|nr:chorismate synthase [Ruminococcus flavefaciens]HPY83461.1 chorismate synthase [Ruminococcus flavefaciens]